MYVLENWNRTRWVKPSHRERHIIFRTPAPSNVRKNMRLVGSESTILGSRYSRTLHLEYGRLLLCAYTATLSHHRWLLGLRLPLPLTATTEAADAGTADNSDAGMAILDRLGDTAVSATACSVFSSSVESRASKH